MVLPYSLFPEADSITEQWHCLLKIQVLQQLRVKILQCWNSVLQNIIHVKQPIYGPVSSRAIKLGIKGWKNWSFTSALPDVVFPRYNLALCSHQDSKNISKLGAQTPQGQRWGKQVRPTEVLAKGEGNLFQWWWRKMFISYALCSSRHCGLLSLLELAEMAAGHDLEAPVTDGI